ncbi:MAG: TadE family type IV pilus minor pilin [Lawsonella sp.]
MLRRLLNDDAGMVTVETAYGLAALLVIFVTCVGGLAVGIQQIHLSDTAHTVAREIARGTESSSARRHLQTDMEAAITTQNGMVRVRIQQRARVLPLTLTGQSEIPQEKIVDNASTP